MRVHSTLTLKECGVANLQDTRHKICIELHSLRLKWYKRYTITHC